jgi:polysaccharide biosynthesis protein PelB
MLPDRSKRYAGIDGDIPRLGLASTWQLFLIALMVGALLAMIFPRRELVEKLYAQDTLDELTLSYIHNLYRANTRNTDVAILLARSEQEDMDIGALERMLQAPSQSGDLRQRTEARLILMRAYARALKTSKDPAQKVGLKARLIALMRAAIPEVLPERLAQAFANLAFEEGLPELGTQFLAQIDVGRSATALTHYAESALAKGQYGVASEYFMLARMQAKTTDEARQLFMRGIDTLMAGTQFAQAMLSADQYMGNLENDPQILRYMARQALAAGYPAQAARYARALVFQAGVFAP